MLLPGLMRITTVSIFTVCVAGCISHQGGVSQSGAAEAGQAARPVVSEQSRSLREPDSPYRTVAPGDTLYSIAWESGRDYREIAAWNHISSPYTINPGQRLRVLPPLEPKKTEPRKVPPTTAGGPSSAEKRSVGNGTTGHKTAVASTPVAPAVAKPASAPADARKEKKYSQAASPAAPRPPPAAKSGKNDGARSGFWTWPADGHVLTRHSAGDTKGIDIVGTRGEPVRAAASGRVVYQGSGLRGYGQLIIIKHSDEFLSAYAHNDRIYVKEGDVVKRGQKIADMGSSGSDRVKLHFEIRRQGIPTDPLKYLPKR